ncbi:Rpn family recombination-promoting nuclease/putative transposase [Paenibacillus yanchengensis]|uniref:Rpn family recombination-promoting nuclease/putative transposase n=1 Tax=Paenibacillus yanchengensis TaxID=2035833 RepID=A0ABW4YMR6_9BACL
METAPQEETLHPRHDTSYRFLLSSKKLFVDLLRSFVKRGWVQEVNEEQVEEIPHTFVLQDFKRQEADLVYRVKLQGQDVIFYLLLELQSSVDYRMPYRLLLYQVEIWRYLLQNEATLIANRKSFRLPPIVPIVLYNGKCYEEETSGLRNGCTHIVRNTHLHRKGGNRDVTIRKSTRQS